MNIYRLRKLKGISAIRIITLFLISVFSVLNLHAQNSLKKVTFAPHWIPQAQFAGFYVAKEKGFYKKYGIDLTILPGGPNVLNSKLLAGGGVDIALMWLTNAIQVRSRGVKVVNLAQLVNRSSLMLVAKASSGIKTPDDMFGKTVGIWGGDFQIQPLAFFEKYNLNVQVIHQGNSLNLFLFDGVDVTTAMYYNEYNTLINSGLNTDELNTFFFADYGLNFPEEGIYTTEDFLNNNPEICSGFVKASLEGWLYAFMYQEEAVNIIIKEMVKQKYPFNKPHQRWMLSKMKEVMFPSGKTAEFETLTETSFKFVAEKLIENKLISTVPDFGGFYKPQTTGGRK